MKKLFIVALIATSLVACNEATTTEEVAVDTTVVTPTEEVVVDTTATPVVADSAAVTM